MAASGQFVLATDSLMSNGPGRVADEHGNRYAAVHVEEVGEWAGLLSRVGEWLGQVLNSWLRGTAESGAV